MTAGNVAEALLLSNVNSNMTIEYKEPIALEIAEAYLENNFYPMPVSYAKDHKQVASRTACGDGRTIAAHIKSLSEATPTIQLFGGYSGFNMGMMGALNKGLKGVLTDNEIIAINNEFTKDMKDIYEHTAEHSHDASCGCGHLDRLRANAVLFGITNKMITDNKLMIEEQGISPDALLGDHEEVGVMIIAGSKKKVHKGQADEREEIASVFSNTKDGKQFYTLNVDAMSELLDSAAEGYASILENMYLEKADEIKVVFNSEDLKAILLDKLTRGIHEQTKFTAEQLAGKLEYNTFLFNGDPKALQRVPLSTVLGTLQKFEEAA